MTLHRLHFYTRLAAASWLFGPRIQAADSARQWTDTGSGFTAGTLGNSGQNLYVNRHGELETIRRFDLDGNGHLDLVFNSTHDIYGAVDATFATAHANAISTSQFALDGCSQVLAQDLNGDGFDDLVFKPNQQNVQEQRSSIIIAWGGPEGWSTQRLTRQLPVEAVTGIAAGDLNHDGWPDLITLNGSGWMFGQPEGKVVRVYWGSPDGYLLTHYQDLGFPGAVAIATGGFGPHRENSAVILTENGKLQWMAVDPKTGLLAVVRTVELPLAGKKTAAQAIAVQSGSHSGPSGDVIWVSTNTAALYRVDTGTDVPVIKTISARPATQLALGRLDDDVWPDLVLTDLKLLYPGPGAPPMHSDKSLLPSVTVLWGNAEGVDAEHPTELAIPNASAATIGDLNRDGHGDLAVAVFQGDTSLHASSLVFFGDGSRSLPAAQPVATEGATGVAIVRCTPSAAPVAIFANSQHRTLDDAVPVRVYWGIPGGFSRDQFVDIPNLGGYKSSAADLNGDGYVDLVVINGGDVSPDQSARAPDAGAKIYWGGPTGNLSGPGPTKFDTRRYSVLHEQHLGSINVADLNHDGYLDLVLGAFETPGEPNTHLVIYYGGPDGFSRSHRKALVVPGRSIGCLIADFNRDGELDIAIGSVFTNQVITYWGHHGEYSEQNRTALPYPQPVDLEAADFNHDGWLDLIVSSYQDSLTQHHDTGLSIFWGGPAGWHQSRSQWLPGMTPLGLAVADLDGDGYLDLVTPHYHGDLTRERLPNYIFWGGKDGFTPLNRTALTVDSGSEAVIADFDGDGKLDIAFCAHSVDAGHRTESPIFFNDGRRFASPRVQTLPTFGPHYMWVQDIGNIYNRRNEENFTSRVFTWSESQREGRLAVQASSPFGARTRLQVRSAANAAVVTSAPWRPSPEGRFPLASGDRALQYRLDLLSANGDAYPTVGKVQVTLDP